MSSSRGLLWGSSLLVAAATCLPGFYVVLRALDAPSGAWQLLLTERTAQLLENTVLLALTVTATAALTALPLAWLTVSSNLPGRRVFSVLLSLPLAVPSFVFGYVLLAAFGTGGLFAEWGLPAPPVYGFPGAVLALTCSTFPFLFLSFRAVLLKDDPTLLEAAQSLGASPLTAFTRITLPRLLHALRSGGLLVAFYVVSDFGAVSLLQYDTFSSAIFTQLEGSFDRALAALWSLALMLLAASVLVMSGLGARQAPVGRVRTTRRSSALTRLGPFVAPAVALCACASAGVIGLPALVIGVWLFRAGSKIAEEPLLQPAWNSVLAAGLAAAATVLCAVPLAVFAARRTRWPARLLVRSAYASYCLPPIVVALALVSFGIRAVPVLYGTLFMLIFAHVVRFLPQALAPLQSAFLDLSPRLSEAGASLGRPPLSVARTIVVPLVRPGLAAAATLVFLTAMKELPATLLLAPIGFRTLSTYVWSATAEGRFAAAAPPALVLVLVSSVLVASTLRQEAPRPREVGW
jgi:iron(III) transport system permease protein